jgi:hypothetical protein
MLLLGCFSTATGSLISIFVAIIAMKPLNGGP